jgi:hypothetical protein
MLSQHTDCSRKFVRLVRGSIFSRVGASTKLGAVQVVACPPIAISLRDKKIYLSRFSVQRSSILAVNKWKVPALSGERSSGRSQRTFGNSPHSSFLSHFYHACNFMQVSILKRRIPWISLAASDTSRAIRQHRTLYINQNAREVIVTIAAILIVHSTCV